jgi:hypothetical protein
MNNFSRLDLRSRAARLAASAAMASRSTPARRVYAAWMASVFVLGLSTPMAARPQPPCRAPSASSPDPRYTSAYGRFVQRADQGDAAAASAALFMLHHGKALFGSEWSATEGQQSRWKALAINAARYQLPVVSNGADD